MNAKSDQNDDQAALCAESIVLKSAAASWATVAAAVAPEVDLGASIAIETKSRAEVGALG
jgi:hypothetical protein